MQLKARETGLTASELVRRAVRETYRSSAGLRKQAMLDFIGIRKDRSGLPSTDAYLRKLRAGSRLERQSGK